MVIILFILTGVILFFSAFLYKIASGESVYKMNMLNYSFWVLGIICVPGSLSVILNLPLFGYDPNDSRLSEWYGNDSTKLLVLICVIWMMFAIPIGAIICNKLFLKINIKKLVFKYRFKAFNQTDIISEEKLFRYITIIGLLSTFVVLSLLPSSNPLTVIINGGNVIDAQITRKNLVEGTGNQIVDMIVNDQLVQLFCFISLAAYYIYSSRKWKLFFYIYFFISIFISVSSGSTGRLMYFFLGIAFLRSMVNGTFIRIKEVLLILILLVPMFIYFKGASGSFYLIIRNEIISRIFLTQIFGFYAALTIFPNLSPHIYFSSTAKFLHNIFNLNFSEDYGRIMMNFTQYEGVLEGHAGHVTTIFMGEAWANFGLFGIIFAPLWVGFFVQFINLYFLKKPKTIFLISVYTIISLTFAYSRDFISFYYLFGFFINIFGFYIFYKLLSFFTKTNQPNHT